MKIRLPLFLALLGLVSCGGSGTSSSLSSFSSESTISSNEESSSIESSSESAPPQAQRYALGEQYNYHWLNGRNNSPSLPTSGDVNILVLFIEFTDFPFAPDVIDDMKVSLEGSLEQTRGFYSLSEYYHTSSFGQVNLDFVYGGTHKTGLTAEEAYQKYSSQAGSNFIFDASKKYLQNAPKSEIDSLDSDEDGYIDGVIAYYSCFDYRYYKIRDIDQTGYYWAYSTAMDAKALDRRGELANYPLPYRYIWCSFDFMYEHRPSRDDIDAHTIIHETGHMFGLDDYYASDSYFNPCGMGTMMDGNYGDQDCFSKLSLGWVEPYVATEPCTVTLRPSSLTGDCLLLPCSDFNGSPFDEYLLLEFFTPDGLNQYDSDPKTRDYLGLPKAYGVRLFHIDARLMGSLRSSYASSGEYVDGSLDDYDFSAYPYYNVAATNCHKEAYPADKRFSLIHMIEASGSKDFARGGTFAADDLFAELDYFDYNDYMKAFFPNEEFMNNDTSFPWNFLVQSMDEESVTISVEAR